jgi:hypothetical protein
LEAQGSRRRSPLVRLLPWEGASAGLDAQSQGGWQVGPSISAPLPIFDSGEARRAVNTAEQLEARHELTLAKRRVVEDVRVAYQGLAASTANLGRIERELIPLQRQRRQLAEDAYRAGQTDVTPLFLAEQDMRVAQTQAIEVEAQAARALVRLQRAVGGPGVAEQTRRRGIGSPSLDAARCRSRRPSTEQAVSRLAMKNNNTHDDSTTGCFSRPRDGSRTPRRVALILSSPAHILRRNEARTRAEPVPRVDAAEQDDHSQEDGHAHGVEGEAEHADEVRDQDAGRPALGAAPHDHGPARVGFNTEAMAHVGSPLRGRAVEVNVRVGDT